MTINENIVYENMFRGRGVLLGFLAIFLLFGCHSGRQTTSSIVLRRGIGGEPSTLDPAATADNFSNDVLRDLYEGLVAETATGKIVPGVATSWEIDESGTQYTFNLRPEAHWSNGAPLLAKHFVAAWQRVVDPKRASPVADDLRLIAGASAILSGIARPNTLGIYAPSDHILVVKLERPAPYLPQLLTHSAAYPIYSEATATTRNAKAWVSNGPYVLMSWAPGTSLLLKKNANYWDHTNVSIPQVTYEIADERSQLARYRAGELDMTDTVPMNAIAALRANQSNELVVAPFLATAYFGLNLSVAPFANNLKLRQAVAMAIDRRRLVQSLGFGQLGAFGFVPPGTTDYSAQAWKWNDLNDVQRISQARELYKEAGFSITTPLHLRLLYNSDPAIRNTAIVVAGMWKDTLGIETLLVDQEYRVFLESRHNKSLWDVVRLGWTADYNDPGNFLDILRSTSNNNDSGYNNSAFDSLLDEAANTSNPQRRFELLESAEKLMLADYPIIPLYFYVSKRLVKPFITGVQSNPLNRLASKYLSLAPH